MCFLVLVFLMGLSDAIAGGSWRNVSLWTSLGLLYGFSRYRLPQLMTTAQLARCIMFLVFTIFVVCAIQYVTDSTFGALAQYFPGGVIQDSQVFDVGGGLKRVQGPFFHTNLLAQWLTYTILWLVGFTRVSASRMAAFATLSCAAMLLFTFARAGWVIAPLVVAGLAITLYRRQLLPASRLVATLMAALFGAAMIALLAPASWFARFQSDQGSSQVRSVALRTGLRLFGENPFFGIGNGNFIQRDPGFGQTATLAPHNIFVLLGSEQGIFVAAAFIALVLGIVVAVRRSLSNDREQDPLRLAALGIILAWMGFCFFYESAIDYALAPTVVLLCTSSLGPLWTDQRELPTVTANFHRPMRRQRVARQGQEVETWA